MEQDKKSAWLEDLETLELILMLEALGLSLEYLGPNCETRYDLVKRLRGWKGEIGEQNT